MIKSRLRALTRAYGTIHATLSQVMGEPRYAVVDVIKRTSIDKRRPILCFLASLRLGACRISHVWPVTRRSTTLPSWVRIVYCEIWRSDDCTDPSCRSTVRHWNFLPPRCPLWTQRNQTRFSPSQSLVRNTGAYSCLGRKGSRKVRFSGGYNVALDANPFNSWATVLDCGDIPVTS